MDKPNLDTFKETALHGRLDSAAALLVSGEWPCTWGNDNGPGEGVVTTFAVDGPVKGPIVKQVG